MPSGGDFYFFLARVRGAFLVAGDRFWALLVLVAFFTAVDLAAGLLFLADFRTRERAGFPAFPFLDAGVALLLVFAETFRLAFGFSAAPALFAFERPLAIAFFADRAPSRILSTISSLMNSPACVLGDFPCDFAFFTRLVFFSGINSL
jgi:hypothetical protein